MEQYTININEAQRQKTGRQLLVWWQREEVCLNTRRRDVLTIAPTRRAGDDSRNNTRCVSYVYCLMTSVRRRRVARDTL